MSYIQARIIYVDAIRNRFDAIALNGSGFYSDVEYLKTGSREKGEVDQPEIGDMAVLNSLKDGCYELERYYHQRSFNADSGLPSSVDIGRGASPLAPNLPGDWQRRGPDGAFMSLLRGVTANLGAGPLCQTLYLGLEGLIRTVCQNYEAIGSGFRVFSINDGGEIMTRLCFSSKDHFVSRGVNENEEAFTENFEYQFDITADGFSLFVGEINPDTGKRHNNFILNIKQSGDLRVCIGEKTIFSIYDNGCAEFDVIDNSGKSLYHKSVATDGVQALVEERIIGNYIRTVDGNLTENVTGDYQRKANNEITISNISDRTTVLNKQSATITVKDLEPAPSASFRTT